MASILGLSPYLTAYQLFRIKAGLEEQVVDNPATYRGRKFEDKARACFELQCFKDFKPKLFQSEQYPYMRVSLDGWNEEDREILEIKVPGKETMRLAENGEIPPHYFAQIQYQLFVANGKKAIYYAFHPETETSHIVEVFPDQDFILKMIALVTQFWMQVQRKEPPELSDRDWAKIPEELKTTCYVWLEGDAYAKALVKPEIIRKLKAKKARGFGIKVFPVFRGEKESYTIQIDKKEEGMKE